MRDVHFSSRQAKYTSDDLSVIKQFFHDTADLRKEMSAFFFKVVKEIQAKS